MLRGERHHPGETPRRSQIGERGKVSAHITPGNRGELRLGAAMSRFTRCEQGWPCKSRRQVNRPGRKRPSEIGKLTSLLGRPARTRGQHAPTPRSHGLAPTRPARSPGWLPADVWSIMLRHAASDRTRSAGAGRRLSCLPSPFFFSCVPTDALIFQGQP
jgi:hypothetical protein